MFKFDYSRMIRSFVGPSKQTPRARIGAVRMESLENRRLMAADPSPLVWLAMDDGSGHTVSDSSGNGYDGTAIRGPKWTAGENGGALTFDASRRESVSIADDPALDLPNALTLSAWIQPTDSNKTRIILEKAKLGTRDGYELNMDSDGTIYFRLDQSTYGDKYRIESNTSLPADSSAWTNVTATYDGKTMSLYINGVLEASKSASITIGANPQALTIGAQANGSRAFDGSIDDVRIYNTALTASQVTKLVSGTTTAVPPPPSGPTIPTSPTTPTSPTDPTPPTDPDAALNLLFYGNSFTNGYETGKGNVIPVPTLLSEIAVDAGFAAPNIVNDAVNKQDLAYHLAHFDKTDVSADLDYVILQEFSTKPTDISYKSLGDAKSFKADALSLLKDVQSVAPGVQPVLYETWGDAVTSSNLANYYPNAASSAAAAKTMQAQLRKYYAQAADTLNTYLGNDTTQIAPVGDAFEDYGSSGLYDSDSHHASNSGYALSAIVMFETIYDTDVKTVNLSSFFAAHGISKSTGAALQATASAELAGTF